MTMVELRQSTRMPLYSRAFVELMAAGAGGGQQGRVAICDIVDVSRGGLRVALETSLTEGAILHIAVEVEGRRDPLYLAGEVKYCVPEPAVDGRWNAGFRLIDASNSDIDTWYRLAERYVALAGDATP